MANEENKKQVWLVCASCDRETWHSILFSHTESEYEYRVMVTLFQNHFLILTDSNNVALLYCLVSLQFNVAFIF